MNDTSADGSPVDRLAVRTAERNAVLTSLGVTHPEAALFVALSYGFNHARDRLPWRAAGEYSASATEVTTEECREALTDSLAKGWLQILDERAVASIANQLRRDGVIGPIYGGLPEAGCVDFTTAGAELWLRFDAEWGRINESAWPWGKLFAYSDVVRDKTAHFYRSRDAALRGIEELRQPNPFSISDPIPIGPWRAEWWRCFPEGFRVDVEEHRQWQGDSWNGSEHCWLRDSHLPADLKPLQQILHRHNVSLLEWLMLESADRANGSYPPAFVQVARHNTQRRLQIEVSDEECHRGLNGCLQKEWLRVADEETMGPIRDLLEREPALLAVPETAIKRFRINRVTVEVHETMGAPLPDRERLVRGHVDFSPAGAALYRGIAAEWLGPDWEDALDVSNTYFCEEHLYCESNDELRYAVTEHTLNGESIISSRVLPIGPWCVYWWQQFPAGYRLETQFCSSAAKTLDPTLVDS